jgi:hypothetical protein
MERNYFDHKPRGCWPIYMKQFKKQLVFVVIGFTGCLVLAGCVSQVINDEMTRRNEAALKKGQITPAQYRLQRDEIDRNLK